MSIERKSYGDKQLVKKAGVCFEPLEPRVLLSGSWGTGAPTAEGEFHGTADNSFDQDTVLEPFVTDNSDKQEQYGDTAHGTLLVDLLDQAASVKPFDSVNTTGTADPRLATTGSEHPVSPAIVDIAQDTPPDERPGLTDDQGQAESAREVSPSELVLINGNVTEHELLVADLQNDGADRHVEVVILDAQIDGIGQVTNALSTRQDLAAIHFISHGSQGQINLGNTWLSSTNLAENSAAVASWGQALTDTGDILFYGCNIAADGDGQSLLDDIAHLTGADVAASDDTTGHDSLGGDWDLEYATGSIETDVSVRPDNQQGWSQLLAAPNDIQVTASSNGGLSLNEDGGNDVYLVADDGGGLLGGLTTLTIEASFSVTTPAADNTVLLSYADGTNDEELALFIKNDGSIWFCARSQGASYQSTAAQYTQLFDGEIHHVGASWDASSGSVVFYVDGQLVEAFSGYQTGQTITGGGELVFGQDQDSELGGFNAIDLFSGTLYDVRIFNDVRTAGEIAANYNQTLPGSESGMIANWTFNDLSTGGVVVDSVGGNNLTVQHVGAGGGFAASTPELTLRVEENALNGTVVGTITGIDPDAGDTLTYSLPDNAGGRFEIVSGTGVIRVADGSLLNYESNTSHNVTVRVTDTSSNTYDEVFTIQVTNVDESPVAVADSVYLSFDGDDIIRVADDPSLQMTDNVTMEVWINHSGLGTGSQLIVNKEGEYELGITADTGEIKYAIADSTDSWAWYDTGHFVTPGEWAHVAVTFDGVAGEINTYINGALVDTYAQAGPMGDVYSMYDNLTIGGRENATNQRFQGLIDEVRVWNTTRTQGEIQANMNGLLTGAEAGLAGYWRLDEAGTGTAMDQSANSNHGTLGGAEGASATPAYQGYSTDEDTLLTIPVSSGVLDNDSDAEGDALTVTNLDTTGMLGSLVMNTADGSFTYDPRGALDALRGGEQIIETFTYTAFDGTSDSNTVTVSITVTGINDAPAVSVTNAAPTFVENGGAVGLFSSASVDPVDTGDRIDTLVISVDGLADGTDEILVVDGQDIELTHLNSETTATGGYTVNVAVAGSLATVTITKTGGFTAADAQPLVNGLAYNNVSENPQGTTRTVTLVSITDDGGTANGGVATTSIGVTSIVTISALDDAAVISGDVSFSGNEGDAAGGDMDATDVEGLSDGTYFTITNQGTNGTAAINATTGVWTFSPGSADWFGADSFEVTITDDLGGTTTQLVTITLSNVNDLPTIGGVDTGTATEDVDPDLNGMIETAGVLTIMDPDAGESVFQAETVAGTYGNLTIDAGGNWSYAADNAQAAVQQLDAGQSIYDVLTVRAADGTPQTVTITITGSEDTSAITGPLTGTVIKDAVMTTGGALTITDPDADDNPIRFNPVAATPGDSGYGHFTLSGGSWTYRLNSAHAAVMAMGASDTLTDSFTFTADDGSTCVVIVTINGNIAGDNDGTPSAIGVTDPDPDPDGDIEPEPPPEDILPVEEEQPPPEPVDVLPLQPGKNLIVTPVKGFAPGHFVPTISVAPVGKMLSDIDHPQTQLAQVVKYLKRELANRVEGSVGHLAETVFSSESVSRDMNFIRQQIYDSLTEDAQRGQLIIGAATGIGVSVFAGYVIWAFRGASLLLGALSAMPIWRCFDTLPVITSKNRDREEDDEAGRRKEKLDEEEERVRKLLSREHDPCCGRKQHGGKD